MFLNFIKNQNCITINEFQKYIKDLLQSVHKTKENNYTRILHLANFSSISLPQNKDEYIISKYNELNNILLEIKNSNKTQFDNLLKLMGDHLNNISKKLDEISYVEIPHNSNINPAVIQEICNDYNRYCNHKFQEAESEIVKLMQSSIEKINNINQNIDNISNKKYNSQNHELIGNESRFILKELKSKINSIVSCLKDEIDKLSKDSEISLKSKQKEQKYANHIHLIQFMDNVLNKISNIEYECMAFHETLINSSKILRDNMSDIVSEITKIRTSLAESEEIFIS